MSDTSFRAAEPAERDAHQVPGSGRELWGLYVDVVLFVFCAIMLALMVLWEGEETVPYHFLFLAVAIVYGLRVWPLGPTVFVLAAVTLSTGSVMYQHYKSGAIESASELAEIWLMPALLIAMVWHARRRADAQRRAEFLADQRRAGIEREREFFRDTSHAIRTPVTIARGHLELLEPTLPDQQSREDVAIALRQLDRMSSMSNRLLALAQLDSGIRLRLTQLDLARFICETGENWVGSADRAWVVVAPESAWVEADAEWLSLAVDALIENAVRFSEAGGRIEIRGLATADTCLIRVFNTGEGIDVLDLDHVFERFWHRRSPSGEMGSGLGLPMARASAHAHGGEVVARNEPGGVAFELELPRVDRPGLIRQRVSERCLDLKST